MIDRSHRMADTEEPWNAAREEALGRRPAEARLRRRMC
jgi:hypothetical protein